MTADNGLKDLERRYVALDKIVRRLEDGFAVEASLAARDRERHEKWMERHEKWLEGHQRALETHNQGMQEHHQAMLELDKKLDRIADLMGFRGGNGH